MLLRGEDINVFEREKVLSVFSFCLSFGPDGWLWKSEGEGLEDEICGGQNALSQGVYCLENCTNFTHQRLFTGLGASTCIKCFVAPEGAAWSLINCHLGLKTASLKTEKELVGWSQKEVSCPSSLQWLSAPGYISVTSLTHPPPWGDIHGFAALILILFS